MGTDQPRDGTFSQMSLNRSLSVAAQPGPSNSATIPSARSKARGSSKLTRSPSTETDELAFVSDRSQRMPLPPISSLTNR